MGLFSQPFEPSVNVQPTLSATIQTDQWNLTSETASNSSLSVLVGSVLILSCTGHYPVKWFGDNEKISTQSLTISTQTPETSDYKIQNPDFIFFDNDASIITRGSEPHKFPTNDPYKATLVFQNFSKADAGEYTCAWFEESRTISNAPLTTSASIRAHEALQDTSSSRFRILQCGFRNVTLHRECAQETHRAIATCVYTVPSDAFYVGRMIYGTLYTVGRAYETSMNQTVLFKVATDTHGSSFLMLQSKLLNYGLCQTSWTGFLGSGKTRADARLVFEWKSENGSVLGQHSEEFEASLEDACQWSNELSMRNTDTLAHAAFGQYHAIDIQIAEANSGARISWAVSQQLAGAWSAYRCGKERRLCTLAEATSVCGVLGVSWRKRMNAMIPRIFKDRYRNQSIPLVQWGESESKFVEEGQVFEDVTPAGIVVRIFMLAKKPCLLDLFQGSSKRMNVNLVVYDARIFGDAFDRATIATVPKSVVSGTHLFVNDTFVLQCLVPTCYMGMTKWCRNKRLCKTYHVSTHIESPDRVLDYTFNYGFYDRSNLTVAFDIVFQRLRIEDRGRYMCTVQSPLDVTIWLDESFDSVVDQPARPRFDDGIDTLEQEIGMNRGADLTLPCIVTGDPQPQISWMYRIIDEIVIIENFGENTFPYISSPRNNATLKVNLPGIYQCNITNRFGSNSRTFLVRYNPEPAYWPLAIGIPVAMVVLFSTVYAYWLIKRRNLKKALRRLAKSLRNPRPPVSVDADAISGYVEAGQSDSHASWVGCNYEISIDQFTLGQQLGKGEFGLVHRGRLKFPAEREVAVKIPSDAANIRNFEALVAELNILSRLKPHVNVLGLVGACTSRVEHGELYVIMDLCRLGTLRDYLIKHKVEFEAPKMSTPMQFSKEALLDYSYQTANGLAYLADQNIIHRDIALRNLLLTDNHVVKISDFGLSKVAPSIYNKKFSDCGKMPLFWMALESIKSGIYSQESDVWSFGILVWEIFSCGRHPYPDCDNGVGSIGQTAFVHWLQEGNRLYPPRLAHNELYEIMCQCWNEDAAGRPSFAECRAKIAKLINATTLDDIRQRMARDWSHQCEWFQERCHSKPFNLDSLATCRSDDYKEEFGFNPESYMTKNTCPSMCYGYVSIRQKYATNSSKNVTKDASVDTDIPLGTMNGINRFSDELGSLGGSVHEFDDIQCPYKSAI